MRGDLVDTREDPFAAAARRRGHIVRLAFPFLTALILIAAIVAITLYTERVNRRDALDLTQEVVRATQNSVRREVEAYLAPTRAVVSLLAGGVAGRGVSGRGHEDTAVDFAMRRSLASVPEVRALFVGDAEGDFVMVQRQDGRLLTKLVARSGGSLEVRWLERGEHGAIVEERSDPEDTYDPTTREWFSRALASDTVAWSDVYRFFSTGHLGITASVEAPTPANLPATVVGADLELAELGAFLDRQDVGEGGRALIVSQSGALIAASGAELRAVGEDAPQVYDLRDPVVDEAFARFRIEREALGLLRIDDVRYLVSATSLESLVGRDWWVLLVIPERAFVGFVSANARTSLWLSAGVIALATIVAALLTVQSVQSDRRAARARRSEEAVRAHEATLLALADVGDVGDPADATSLKRFSVTVADAAGARRVGVWRLADDRSRLVNIETYDREVRAHTAAATLPADHLAAAWPRLTGDGVASFPAEDASPAAQQLREVYLTGVGSSRLDVLPVTSGERTLGAVWIEDARPDSGVIGAESLARLMASLLAPRLQRLAAADRGERGTAEAPASMLPRPEAVDTPTADASRRTLVAQGRERALLDELGRHGGMRSLEATLHPRVAFLHLRLGAALAMAQADEAAAQSALSRVVAAAREGAERLGVAYLKVLGDVMVAAEGFGVGGDGDARLPALADLALELQPVCRAAERRSGLRTSFRMGLDVGAAFGGDLDAEADVFNLWGEACRLAERMAESAPATGIQVTEAAYDRLSRDFLLRRRGSFFIEGVGETETYLLTGRL